MRVRPLPSTPAARVRLALCAAIAAAIVLACTAQGATTVAIFTIAGGPGQGFRGEGKLGTDAALDGPAGIVAAPDGSVIVADTINQRIRRIDPTGRIRTIAGNGDSDFTGDGGPASHASFQDPTALALGPDGSLYVADTGNSRIRVIRPGGTVSTLAGTADQGFSGDGGPSTAAQVTEPAGVAVDATGRLFFSDTGNNRIRVIGTDGTINTIAGSGQRGSAGDRGPAKVAQLDAPAGLAFAADGSLLIADAGNNEIRRVATDGTITTVAGTGGGGSGGDGGAATAAQLNNPLDVAAGPQGDFYIAEQGGKRVRHVDVAGMIGRVAGTGAPRFGGDGRAARSSFVNAPHALELMASGQDLLIADTDNNRIRYVPLKPAAALLAIAPLKTSLTAPLVKNKKKTIVADVPITFRTSKEATVSFSIKTKRGKPVTTLKTHVGPGAAAFHLPARLRAGKHRLKKDHYVVGVIAKAGSASSTSRLELIVK